MTSVLPQSSFLTPTTRRAPEINVLAADSVNLNVHVPLETPLLLHDEFPFLQSDSYKIIKPYIAPFDHEDRPQTLLVCGRRLAVLQERRHPISKPSRENLFRFGNYFVTDDGKATTKTVVGDEKVPAVIFSRNHATPKTSSGVFIRPRSRGALGGVLKCRGPYPTTDQPLIRNLKKAPP